MMFAWSHTFYAKRNGIYFNFEQKKDRDDAVRRFGFEKVSAKEAYKNYSNMIQVEWREYERMTKGCTA